MILSNVFLNHLNYWSKIIKIHFINYKLKKKIINKKIKKFNNFKYLILRNNIHHVFTTKRRNANKVEKIRTIFKQKSKQNVYNKLKDKKSTYIQYKKVLFANKQAYEEKKYKKKFNFKNIKNAK